MQVKLVGPLYDLSERGELTRRLAFLFLRNGFNFSIKVVPEIQAKINADLNTDTLSAYINEYIVIEDVLLFTSRITNLDIFNHFSMFNNPKAWFQLSDNEKPFGKYFDLVLYDAVNTEKSEFANSQPFSLFSLDSDTQSKSELQLDGIPKNSKIVYSIVNFKDKDRLESTIKTFLSYDSTSKEKSVFILKTHSDYYSKEETEELCKVIDRYKTEFNTFDSIVYVLHNNLPRNAILGLHKMGDILLELRPFKTFNLIDAWTASTAISADLNSEAKVLLIARQAEDTAAQNLREVLNGLSK